MSHRRELLGMPARPARADAVRNREHLLLTARRLVAERGVDALTMDLLAQEAHLGKGTIFRRFGSRSGLFRELVDDVERDFQAAYLRGPAPLGPGADEVERLVAFGRARLALYAGHRELMCAAALDPAAAPDDPVTRACTMHVHMLLGALGLAVDVEQLAVNLVAVLEAARVPEPSLPQGAPCLERVADGWEALVRAVCAGAPRRTPAAAPGHPARTRPTHVGVPCVPPRP